MGTIYIDLDNATKGFEKLLKNTVLYEKALGDAWEELYIKTDDHMTEEASKYGIDESNLDKSRYIDPISGGFEVGYNAEHAEFVEYGTGVIGQTYAVGNAPASWIYGKSPHIKENGTWVYRKDNDFYTTSGQEPKPIIYNTELWAKKQVTKIFKKHFRKANI